MSKLEDKICKLLKNNKIKYETQKAIPLDKCPWKKGRNIKSKCDIYLPKSNLFIEIKGFMTMFAMTKMSWFCKQNINYFIFQGTEFDWPIYKYDTILNNYDISHISTKSGKLEYNINYQIKELIKIEKERYINNNESLFRLKGFIENRIKEYIKYNGGWY